MRCNYDTGGVGSAVSMQSRIIIPYRDKRIEGTISKSPTREGILLWKECKVGVRSLQYASTIPHSCMHAAIQEILCWQLLRHRSISPTISDPLTARIRKWCNTVCMDVSNILAVLPPSTVNSAEHSSVPKRWLLSPGWSTFLHTLDTNVESVDDQHLKLNQHKSSCWRSLTAKSDASL